MNHPSWPSGTREPGIRAGTALAVILAIASGLRIADLGRNSLWFDEAFVVWVTRLGWQNIPPHGDFHPPLYYLLMKAWVGIAGTGEAAIRFPSACFSVVSVGLAYALARRVCSERVGLLTALLVSVSPFQIMAGQDARMYSLLAMLALASTLALVMSIGRGGALRWAGYVVLAALMVYTQYLGFFVLIAHGIWVASYERVHFTRWLAGMVAAGLLYAPWMPSLWYQTVHMRDWTYWPDGAMYRNLLDLLGLYAFGGSLFGMANYFFGGTLGAVEQFIILLPFLAVLWRGVISLGSERRSLALLGLPPAVTIATMSALYLIKPIFYPRWFSFLSPFYAMFLAQGIVDVAERFRGQRDRSLAFLTAGLLLYSAPVLAHYYFDPGFRPYQWRAAAALVRREVRPGDFFLYVGQAAEISFTYYFRDP
ncbi:MAG TPA: glycosyltransferase family 39 protein [bacterium]|nr:glycosyltransferase family 39 protein [bacterium]